MFIIIISCMSFFHTCKPLPTTPHIYETAEQCDRALLRIAENWKPNTGMYTFNCRATQGSRQ